MSESEQRGDAPNQGEPFVERPIHFEKGAHFHVVHADGVWFGGSPFGDVHLTFYSERFPIPKKLILRFFENGEVVEDESKRELKSGFVREMEVDIVLTAQSALALYESLAENLKFIKERVALENKK